jgi:hypothetical protein
MKKNRQYRSRQGRSDKQYESSALILVYSAAICILMIIGYVIVNAVGTLLT